MSEFVQLIVDGVVFPSSTHDNYSAYEMLLTEQMEVADRSIVEEISGWIWKVEYSYDYMGMAKLRECLNVLRAGGVHSVSFVPDDSDERKSGRFLVESVSAPSLAFVRGGEGRWHNISFVLREVSPHDRSI